MDVHCAGSSEPWLQVNAINISSAGPYIQFWRYPDFHWGYLIDARPLGYKTFLVLNSIEHEIPIAYKSFNAKK